MKRFWFVLRGAGSSLWRVGGTALLLTLILSGCGGGARYESWPGMTLVEDTLYVAMVGQIQAFDAQSGDVFWSFPQEPKSEIGFYAAPAVDEERGMLVAAGFKDHTVHAWRLSATPGVAPTELWTFPGEGTSNGASGQYVSAGVIADGLFVIGNGDGAVYALHVEDGTLAWSVKTGDRVWARPLVAEGTVYVTSMDHHLYALDLEDGRERWRLEMRGALASSPVMVDGRLWVGDFGDQIYQIDPQSGEILWTFEGGEDWFWATPTVGEDKIFFSDVRGNVYAFEIATRKLLWRQNVGDVVRGQGVLNADGSVLLVPGHEHGQIHALDTTDGAVVPWGIVAERPGRLPGDLIASDMHVYAAPIMISTRVKAFDIEDGQLLWAYPPPEE